MAPDPNPLALDEPRPEPDDRSALARGGALAGGAVAAGLAASVPAALRVAEGGSLTAELRTWLSLAALLLPVAALGIALLRSARDGVRTLAGDGERVTLLATSVLWWCVVELGLLSVFGAVLRAKTHQHSLAGVTFAAFALATGAASALVAVRGARWLAARSRAFRRAALSAAALAVFVSLVLVGMRMARAEHVKTAASLVDVLALAVACAIGSSRGASRLRAAALVGAPLAVAVLVLGVSTLRSDPSLAGALGDGAPVHAWIARWVAG